LERDETPLSEVDYRQTGTIEDDEAATLQIDFANKHIGGGVLGHGCIQEEIRSARLTLLSSFFSLFLFLPVLPCFLALRFPPSA
jgi:hypothetical protein